MTKILVIFAQVFSLAPSRLGTLAGAYAALGDEGGTLVFMNEYPINGAKIDLAAHTGKITWTSVWDGTDYRENGGALKWFTSHRIGLGGPTEIDRFRFIDAGNGVLAANFHDLTIGKDVATLNASGAVEGKILITGGANNNAAIPALASDKSSVLTIQSGSYISIIAFSRMVNNVSHEGTVTVNLSGNTTVTDCYLGANGTGAKGGTTVLNISDNAKITGTLYLASLNATTNGSVTVNMTDNAKVGAFLRYLKTYFPNGTRTLVYDETATLPASLADHFDNISIRNKLDRSGDANGDGVTTLVDVIRVLRASADATVEISKAADVNADGVYTVADVLLILKICLNA